MLSSASDPDGDVLTVIAWDGRSTLDGSVLVFADGSFAYKPRPSAFLQNLGPGEFADDTFTWTVSDGRGGTATATVTIRVRDN